MVRMISCSFCTNPETRFQHSFLPKKQFSSLQPLLHLFYDEVEYRNSVCCYCLSATMRKVAEDELPLPICLSWCSQPGALDTHRFVLQENDAGEILVSNGSELSYVPSAWVVSTGAFTFQLNWGFPYLTFM